MRVVSVLSLEFFNPCLRYAECYPGLAEMDDAVIDSDDEADFSKMDMGNKKGPVGRWVAGFYFLINYKFPVPGGILTLQRSTRIIWATRRRCLKLLSNTE